MGRIMSMNARADEFGETQARARHSHLRPAA